MLAPGKYKKASANPNLYEKYKKYLRETISLLSLTVNWEVLAHMHVRYDRRW